MPAERKGNRNIAGVLNRSVYTVETHQVRIMNKMNMHNIPGLVTPSVAKRRR